VFACYSERTFVSRQVDALRVELPLPDADGRRRLIELYGEGLELPPNVDESLIASLEGVSPAFIRELLRRAALLAADDSADGALRVGPDQLEHALEEFRRGATDLTNALLGGPGEDPHGES
jgi:ATP-dependent 26S proteasome regulatory subunit